MMLLPMGYTVRVAKRLVRWAVRSGYYLILCFAP